MKNRKDWPVDIVKMAFNLDQSHPVTLIHHSFTERQKSNYDMHYGLELGILTKGQIKRHYKGCSTCVEPGQIWLCGMWEPHGWEVSQTPCEAFVFIIFPPMMAKTYFEEIPHNRWIAPFIVPQMDRPQIQDEKKQKIIEIADSLQAEFLKNTQIKQAYLHLKLLEILLIILDGWEHPQDSTKQNDTALEMVNAALQLVFNESVMINTQKAAEICKVNRNYFATNFKEIMGISFSEFTMRYRCSRAAEEILSSDHPIKAIAKKWGFTDSSHFHRCFIKYYNCRPCDYRKS